MAEEADARPPSKPPGPVAWGLMLASVAVPAVGGWLGYAGISDDGNITSIAMFIIGLVLVFAGGFLALIVHLGSMVRAFYPRISGPWMTICVVSLFGCFVMIAVGIVLIVRLQVF